MSNKFLSFQMNIGFMRLVYILKNYCITCTAICKLAQRYLEKGYAREREGEGKREGEREREGQRKKERACVCTSKCVRQ